jgi:hypothetical protein
MEKGIFRNDLTGREDIKHNFPKLNTLIIQDVEKLHDQTSWGDREDQNKDLLTGNVCQRCILAVLWTAQLGLTTVGRQGKPLKYSQKSCISYHFRADIQMMGINFNKQLTTMQQSLMCVLKNARLLLPQQYEQ